MRYNMCTIRVNGSETERQTIFWDDTDLRLWVDMDCSDTEGVVFPVDDYTYDTPGEAMDACREMWGDNEDWDLQWITDGDFRPMKHWKVDYSVRYGDPEEDEEHFIFVAGRDIAEAVIGANERIWKMMRRGIPERIVIWSVSIMEDDVF